MNKIIAASLFEFNRLLDKHTDLNSLFAFISIQDPDAQHCDQYRFRTSSPGVLVMQFYDINQRITDLDGTVYEPMTDVQAHEILRFIEANRQRHFLVHCTAGIARSGAVATFIHEYLTERNKEYVTTYEEFKRDNRQIIPNLHVLTQLRAALAKTLDS